MASSDCPGCGVGSELGDTPVTEPGERAVLTCIHCGYVGTWDVEAGGWRLLRPEEHRELIDNEEYLESINFGFAFRAWRDRDTARLCAVLHSQLDKAGVSRAVVETVAKDIINAGYHTHPTEDDARALGLGRFGGAL